MKKIKELLKEKSKTRTWLAKELGVSRQRVTMLLKQEDMMLNLAFKIADALEVDINEFRKE